MEYIKCRQLYHLLLLTEPLLIFSNFFSLSSFTVNRTTYDFFSLSSFTVNRTPFDFFSLSSFTFNRTTLDFFLYHLLLLTEPLFFLKVKL